MPRRSYKKKRYTSKTEKCIKYMGGKASMFLAKQAMSGVRYLKGLVNSELFKYEINDTGNSIDASGTIINLNEIAQGDGDAGRTGNSILAKSLYLNFDFSKHNLATNTYLRMLLFIDKQQISDTYPSVTDVLDTASVLAPLNNATVGRFTILRDMRVVLNDNRPGIFFKIYKKLFNHIRFNGGLATDTQKGGVYLLFISNEATNAPTVSFRGRLCYHDN